MAVYTTLQPNQFIELCAVLELKPTGAPGPVPEGIENSTFFFTASRDGKIGEYVLTLVESADQRQIDYAIALTQQLARAGLPVPAPLTDRAGTAAHTVSDKPALVFNKAPGQHCQPALPGHCAAIGEFLARAHRAGKGLASSMANTRGLPWARNMEATIKSHLSHQDRELLSLALSDWQALVKRAPPLPSGAIHGDLFVDNALFVGPKLSAVIDYYNACTDWWLLDVAITVNDWCVDDDGNVDQGNFTALTRAYQQIRAFTPEEHLHWQSVLCVASTRFWLSRLAARQDDTAAIPLLKLKSPNPYRQRLVKHRQAVPALPA
ncbi:MAG: homoserine kinase [Porticoccaceae bacterium]|nr:homoserine kinase [Porticoccaceae bacterium]